MSEDMAKLLEAMQQQQTQQMAQFAEILKQVTKQSPVPTELRTVSVPRFESYDRSKELWTQYLQRLHQHFNMYNIADATQQRACLLSWVGHETYELLTKLFGSVDITQQTFAVLSKKLSDHFEGRKHVQAARYEFYNCQMKPNQTYSDWAADLRGIARSCNFVCKKHGCGESYVDDQIRDIIIKDTPHADVRRQCLLDTDPSLEDVLRKASTFVTTSETDKVLKGETNTSDITASANQMQSSYKLKRERKHTHELPSETTPAPGKSKYQSCPQCFIDHDRKRCPHRSKQCHNCSRMGHLSSVCQSKTNSNSTNTNHSHLLVEESTSSVYNVYERRGKQVWINATVNGIRTRFQWDTGASCSMVGMTGYKQLGSPPCQQTTTTLKAYGNSPLIVKGECYVSVRVGKFTNDNLRLLIVDSDNATNLLGIDWSDKFNLSQHGLSAVANKVDSVENRVNALAEQFSDVFKSGIGLCKSFQVPIHLKPEHKQCFSKPRPVPYSQLESTRTELQRLESEGVVQRIEFSNWAAPIVVVSKPNGKVRICGDFKRLNQYISIDQHPLPKLDDLMEKLRGGQFFTKLDLADAYLQLELDDEAKQLCVVNTPFGLYRYNRMCFGIASGPAQFQRCMDSLTQDLPGVAAYLDDLIITGRTEEEHWTNLTNLLSSLQKHGFRLRLDKCEFFQQSVEYLGHTIDANGKRANPSAVAALQELPKPKDLQQLQAFLGKINYYGRFIVNLADKAAPLYRLLKDNVTFEWSNDCDKAFTQLKDEIINATSLAHYDETTTLILATDASSYGIGAVLSQQDKDGETPIAYASKTLTDTQTRYSQIEREALSIIYGVTKFKQYLYGRKFKLITDHEPLVTIFSPDTNIPTLTAQRLQRWALTLMGFQFTIQYKPTSKHGNADCLSRLPLGPDKKFDQLELKESQEISHAICEDIVAVPMLAYGQVQQETQKDKNLQTVLKWIQHGWPKDKPTETELQRYWDNRDSLFTDQGVLLLKCENTSRVVVPQSLQTGVLDMLHTSHWGIVKVKQLARRYVWWNSINNDIEKTVKACTTCRQSASAPAQQYTNWPKTDKPWDRLHLDFAGPFHNKMWLLCIDACSKFPYIGQMEIGLTNTQHTVQVLKDIFAIEGFPKTIVTDNGPQFSSKEFHAFCTSAGIQHLTSPPYHPPSNGEAERFVRTFKESVEKNFVGGMTLRNSVRLTLASYRTLPHPALDWKTPAEALHGRQPRGLLSLLRPTAINRRNLDSTTHSLNRFSVDSLVYARNYSSGPRWVPGRVVSQQGTSVYMIQVDNGTIWKRHANQLQLRISASSEAHTDTDIPAARDAMIIPNEPNEQLRRYPIRERRQPNRYTP